MKRSFFQAAIISHPHYFFSKNHIKCLYGLYTPEFSEKVTKSAQERFRSEEDISVQLRTLSYSTDLWKQIV